MVADPGFNCDLILNRSNVQTLHIVQGQWIAWFLGESEFMDEVFMDEIPIDPQSKRALVVLSAWTMYT